MNKTKKRIMGFVIVLIIISIALIYTYKLRESILMKMGVSYRKIYSIKISKGEIESFYKKMNVVEKNYLLKGRKFKYINDPSMIIYHHAAIKNINVDEVDKLHKNRGWDCIGYHYFISKEGIIYLGRPENAEGAHTLGKNKCSIGICLEGNFEEEMLTKRQIESLIRLSEYLCLKFDINKIVGHNDVGNTLCPGKNFPKIKIRDMVLKKVKNYNQDKNTAS